MHLKHVVALPLLLTAGFAWMSPVVLASQRQGVTTSAVGQQHPATPAPPPTRPPAPTPQGKPATPAPTPATAPPLDLKTLEQRLRNTKAIGIFTKITLKNQVNDLLDKFEEYYRGKSKHNIKDLRRSYDLLLMKVLSLLQNDDPPLASAIVASREAIWTLLADPKMFATLRA
jgi:hypothetical protein